jgi:stage II sporulation protein D
MIFSLKRIKKNSFIIFIFLFYFHAAHGGIARIYGDTQPGISGAIPYIRVKMKETFQKVKIKGLDIKRKFHLTNDTRFFPGRKRISINCALLGKQKKFKRPTLVASFASNTGLLTVTKDKYHGLVHVVARENDEQCDVINETDLESYLGGLLSKEMNSSWPIEALKAQAVAARTYAYHKIKTLEVSRTDKGENLFHLENSEKHQVSGDYFDTTESTRKATEKTQGEILLDAKGKLSSIFFHASCGGRTLLPNHVWQNKVKSYRSVNCSYCKKSRKNAWKKSLDYQDLKKFVHWLLKENYIAKSAVHYKSKKIRIVNSKKWDRYFRLYLGDKLFKVKKSHIRRYFGRFKVRSNNFTVSTKEGRMLLQGDGHGHGVGMCQLGALDLAKKGWNYRQILSHYFPAFKIKKIY